MKLKLKFCHSVSMPSFFQEKVAVALFLTTIATVYCWPNFKSKIPNGDKVPCKCMDGMTWQPVGHYNDKKYTQLKNPFGVDFRNNRFVWTKALCQKDSDRDGQTNGQELGDPNCIWTAYNNTPPQRAATGHPGICEPIGSPKCNHQNFSCKCLKNLSLCNGLLGSQ